MENTGKLSAKEFLDDIRLTVTSPASRFPVIQERGALWGSLLLLIGPAYFAFAWWGGIFFDRDPFAGYSFIMPILPAAAVSLLKVFGVHLVARLFEGRGRYTRGKGGFRNLLVVFGYAGIPQIMVVALGLLLIELIPATLGSAFLNLRVIVISLMVGLSIGIFVWNLILMVLALRTVYAMRDYKSVISVIAGPLLVALPTMSLMLVAGDASVDLAQVKPILSERILHFLTAEETEQPGAPHKFMLHADWIVYRFKEPQRFDLVVCAGKPPGPTQGKQKRGGLVIGLRSLWMSHLKGDETVGRIVGLPGERVELSEGRLSINGQSVEEPRLLPEYQAPLTCGPSVLGASDYLVLPEDRRMAATMPCTLTVPRDRILGRAIVRKWPVGWFWFRSTAFAKPGD
jgi:Signal peptidase, peptidase S26/Yip1 domain